VSILQEKDAAFERGEVDLDGIRIANSTGTMAFGSTCHGVGACKVRKILRRKDALLARDVPQLQEFLCDTSEEIINRLDSGQAGLLEIAQGFQLSYGLPNVYPYCTSRNCTVTAGFDDMMLPVVYAGNVLLNLRTYPIRIANNKYIGENGKHLTWAEIQEYNKNNKQYQIFKGNSGPGYSDQKEITWEDVTKNSGSPTPIMEMTSVTKMPRKVFSFSKENLKQAIKYNRVYGHTYISVNFANYVDNEIAGKRGGADVMTPKFKKWLDENVISVCDTPEYHSFVKYIGTGPLTDDKIVL
jgi:hypothetical protein